MTTTTPKQRRWKIDAGNSNTGPCGFVVYDLRAATPEDALAKARELLPQHFENHTYDDDGDEELTVVAYFNPENLTLDNIEEDEDDDDENDEPTALAVDDEVEAGAPATADYDYGRVLTIDGDVATVAWRGSETRTTINLSELRRRA